MDKDIILDLIYPRRCPVCGEIRPYRQGKVCEDCMSKLKKVETPKCMCCGKTIESEEEEYCQDCVAVPKHFEQGFPVFSYREPLKSSIYAFKYKNQREHAEFFADCMFHCYKKEFLRLDLDGIVPVPVHPNKKRKRGYNQAELLAKQLGKRLAVDVFPDYLIRVADTNPQKELNDKERVNNLSHAFQLGKSSQRLKKILLIDDIYTTGATIEACTKVLLSGKAEKVYYTSIAIGKGY